MRVLTVRQPWAWAIIHGGKDVENRVRSLGPYRGPVAIHAGREIAPPGQQIDCARLSERGVSWVRLTPTLGHIIGVVDLVDVHHAGDCYDASLRVAARLYRTDRAAFDALPVHAPELGGLVSRMHLCSPWAEHGAWHLTLTNPRAVEPIPYRGAMGLRTITDPDVLARLEVA